MATCNESATRPDSREKAVLGRVPLGPRDTILPYNFLPWVLSYFWPCRFAMEAFNKPTVYSVLWIPLLPSCVTNSQL